MFFEVQVLQQTLLARDDGAKCLVPDTRLLAVVATHSIVLTVMQIVVLNDELQAQEFQACPALV